MTYSLLQEGFGHSGLAWGMHKLTPEEVERRLSQRGFTLLDEYVDAHHKGRVLCNTCLHVWRINVNAVTNGQGCPECAKARKRVPEDEFRERCRRVGLELVRVGEGMRRSKSRVRCLACNHEYETLGEIVSQGCGCPRCRYKHSVKEDEVRRIFQRITGWKFVKARPDWLKRRTWTKGSRPLELDGYNKTHQVAFEYQGVQHYQPIYGEEQFRMLKLNDDRKRKLCERHGVLLVRVPYWKKDPEGFIRSRLHAAGLV